MIIEIALISKKIFLIEPKDLTRLIGFSVTNQFMVLRIKVKLCFDGLPVAPDEVHVENIRKQLIYIYPRLQF